MTQTPANINPKTISTTALAIARALTQLGHNIEELFQRVEVDLTRVGDPHYRVSVDTMGKLWQLAVQLTGDEAFGLKAAEYLSPTSFHGLGFAAMASRHFDDAIEKIVRNSNVISDIANLQYEYHTDGNILYLLKQKSKILVVPAAIDAFMAALILISRNYMHLDPPLEAVHLTRQPPVSDEHYRQFYRVPVRFGQAVNALIFNPVLSSRPLVSYDADLARVNEQALVSYLQKQTLTNVIHKVREKIAQRLPQEPQQDVIAEQLHMSTRRLQRLLKEEHTTFQQVLDEYRHQQAILLMQQSRNSIEQIAEQLGFANSSGFSRAFKRWQGCAPSVYQKKLHIKN